MKCKNCGHELYINADNEIKTFEKYWHRNKGVVAIKCMFKQKAPKYRGYNICCCTNPELVK